MKRAAPVFTSLGMHFVNVSASEVALVLVEVNVRGLLAMHARRLCKSKRGAASLSSGTVRMTLATPADRELASTVWLREAADEKAIQGLHNLIDEQLRTIDCVSAELRRTRAALARHGLDSEGRTIRPIIEHSGSGI